MNLLKIQGPYCNSPKKNLPANSIRLSNKEQDINKAIKKLTSSSSFWSCTALKPTYNVPPPCKRKISGETQKIRATNHSIKRENKTEVKRNGEKGEETSLHAGRNARERDKTQVILRIEYHSLCVRWEKWHESLCKGYIVALGNKLIW